MSHLRRPAHSRHHPLHITLRVQRGVSSLREGRLFASVRRALAAGKQQFGFSLVHFSVQRDHLHLIAEASDRRALSRGMQGLTIRVARAVNRQLGRSGRLFADRYHARALKTPRSVRLALRYVLLNVRKHQRGSSGAAPGDTQRTRQRGSSVPSRAAAKRKHQRGSSIPSRAAVQRPEEQHRGRSPVPAPGVEQQKHQHGASARVEQRRRQRSSVPGRGAEQRPGAQHHRFGPAVEPDLAGAAVSSATTVSARAALPPGFIDVCSSAPWFDGFARPGELAFGARQARSGWLEASGATEPPVVGAQTWLLRSGWKRAGPFDIDDTPGSERP